MRKIIVLLLLSICITSHAFSQTGITIREIGLFTSDLNSFGVRYKTGTEDLMYRITAFSLTLSNAEFEFSNGSTNDEDEYGFGLAGGIEIPLSLNERFDLFYGGEVAFRYSNRDEVIDENEAASHLKFASYGLGLVLGCSYYLSPKFKLSVEVIPEFNRIRVKEDDVEVKGWQFEVSSQSAGLTLSYRF